MTELDTLKLDWRQNWKCVNTNITKLLDKVQTLIMDRMRWIWTKAGTTYVNGHITYISFLNALLIVIIT